MPTIPFLLILLSLQGFDSPQSNAREGEVREILQRAATYVLDFQRHFASVVTEERYVQIAKPWAGVPKSAEAEPALVWNETSPSRTKSPILLSRRLRSDVLMMQMPDGIAVGYRDVFEVDGDPVRDHEERLRKIFLAGSPDSREQLTRIQTESSKYNLGSAARTVNVPTFPLVYLHPRVQPGVRFAQKEEESIDGVRCTVIDFREVKHPSVVRTKQGRDVLARGRFCIEAQTARVRRAEVLLDMESASGRLDVRAPALGDPPPPALRLGSTARSMVQVTFSEKQDQPVLVPRQLWEWFQGPLAGLPQPDLGAMRSSGLGATYVECLATYTNFRAFTVTTTEEIKKP